MKCLLRGSARKVDQYNHLCDIIHPGTRPRSSTDTTEHQERRNEGDTTKKTSNVKVVERKETKEKRVKKIAEAKRVNRGKHMMMKEAQTRKKDDMKKEKDVTCLTPAGPPLYF